MLKKIIGVVSVLLLILFISCSDDDTDNNTTTASPIGSWTTTIDPEISEAIPYETTVLMTFTDDADTSFSIAVSQNIPGAGLIPVYKSDGTSSRVGEAMIVIGSGCMKLNSETMEWEALPAEMCGTALPIPTTELTENSWTIPGTIVAMLPFLTAEQQTAVSGIKVVFTRVTE